MISILFLISSFTCISFLILSTPCITVEWSFFPNKLPIDLKGMSYKEVDGFLRLIGVKYKLDGYGCVYEQNIEPGRKIDSEIILKLKDKYDSE